MSTPIADGCRCILILITGMKNFIMSLIALNATLIKLKLTIKTQFQSEMNIFLLRSVSFIQCTYASLQL